MSYYGKIVFLHVEKALAMTESIGPKLNVNLIANWTRSFVSNLPGGLNYEVNEGGDNLR